MNISRELGINKQTFYNWKMNYPGTNCDQLKRLKELEDMNPRLKQIYADTPLYNKMLKDVLSKKW